MIQNFPGKSALFEQDLKTIRMCLSVVNNKRQSKFERKTDIFPKVFDLNIPRREIVMVVKSGFSNGYDLSFSAFAIAV